MPRSLDEELEKFRNRPLERICYLYLDAHYEKVRHDGHIRDLAVLKAVGVNEEGHREILGVSVSLSEGEVQWRTFLESLFKRGMNGMLLVVSDDHSGLKAVLRAVMPSVPHQRCQFHIAQNAQAYVPSVSMRAEIAQAVKDVFQALDRSEAERRTKQTVLKYEKRAPKFSRWLEESAPEAMTFYSFPRSHWKKIRTVNVVERLNEEIRRRTRMARLFPNEASCNRLVTAVCCEIHFEAFYF